MFNITWEECLVLWTDSLILTNFEKRPSPHLRLHDTLNKMHCTDEHRSGYLGTESDAPDTPFNVKSEGP